MGSLLKYLLVPKGTWNVEVERDKPWETLKPIRESKVENQHHLNQDLLRINIYICDGFVLNTELYRI